MANQDNSNGNGSSDMKASFKDKIGDDLKQLYDDVVKEPVPDSFMQLLADADKSSGNDPESAQ